MDGGAVGLRRAAGATAVLAVLLLGCCTPGSPSRSLPTEAPPITGGAPVTADPGTSSVDTPVPVTTPVPAATGEAASLLTQLPVKGRAARTGYDRTLFGQAWADVDRNGCDTRNDILRRDSTDLAIRPGTGGCRVDAGVLHDRYSGTAVAYVRGDARVEVDHVVALSDAWQKGAQQLSDQQREAFANDPRNLVATRTDLNQAKSDSDAASWLPPHRPARCDMVSRQIAVKHDHGLWVTAAERDAMARVLVTCPGQGLPTGTQPPPRATATTTPLPSATPAGAEGSDLPSYPSCAAAREAGVAPLHRGDPGYREGLDGDRDGIACE